MKLERRTDLHWERLGVSVALLDVGRGMAHSLDGAAAAVWLACERSTDRSELVAVVAAQGHGAGDVDAVIDSMIERELLVTPDGLGRRALLRRGATAVAIGAVLSIALPEPAAALSTGGPAPELLDKPGWSLTGTLASGAVVSLDSATTAVDSQYAVITIPASPDVPALQWFSDGSYVFPQFVVADEADFAFSPPVDQASYDAYVNATELRAVFYGLESPPQVVGWAYFPSRL